MANIDDGQKMPYYAYANMAFCFFFLELEPNLIII